MDGEIYRRESSTRDIDAYIGERLRQKRLELGLTQEALAAQLKISYQQIQKYESGTNRISAGRLFELARLMDTDISYFFDGADQVMSQPSDPEYGPDNGTGTGPTALPLSPPSRTTIDMMRYFLSIEDPEVQTALRNLVKELSGAIR